jgi:hypothetical protein
VRVGILVVVLCNVAIAIAINIIITIVPAEATAQRFVLRLREPVRNSVQLLQSSTVPIPSAITRGTTACDGV